MGKAGKSHGRKERAAALRAEHARAERRRRILVYGITGMVVVAIAAGTVGAVVYQNANDPAKAAVSSFGVAAADARCQAVVQDPAHGVSDHVGPGTSSPDTTQVDYDTVPPSSGPHYAVPVYPNLPFYGERDAPRVEQLVHNLEHGYTILWYDPSLPEAEQDQVRDLASNIRATTPKFIAAPWDASRGELAGGASVALTHWGATSGYRQLCGKLSGAAVADFVAAHPSTDSPEPNAA